MKKLWKFILLAYLMKQIETRTCLSSAGFVAKYEHSARINSWEAIKTQANLINLGLMTDVFPMRWVDGVNGDKRWAIIKKNYFGPDRNLMSNEIIWYDKLYPKIPYCLPQLYECITTEMNMYLVLEFMVGSFAPRITLANNMHVSNPLYNKFRKSPFGARFLFYREMAKAIHALHDQGVVHHNIRPSTIMFSKVASIEVKLADLSYLSNKGVSVSGGSPEYMDYMKHLYHYYSQLDDKLPEKQEFKRKWILMMDTQKSDIYAFGLTIYELEFGSLPSLLQNPSLHVAEAQQRAKEVFDIIVFSRWMEEAAILCTKNEPKICFNDIVKSMVVANLSEMQGSMKVIVDQMDRIYDENQYFFEQARESFVYGKTLKVHINDPFAENSKPVKIEEAQVRKKHSGLVSQQSTDIKTKDRLQII